MAVRLDITQHIDIPGGVNGPANVLAPTLHIKTALTPPPVSAPAAVLPPTLSIGGALSPATVPAPAAVLAPTPMIRSSQGAAVNAPTAVLAPTLVWDIRLKPWPVNAPAHVLSPALIGDFYVQVVDPPWNVTNIRLIRGAAKASTPREALPMMVGSLLYDWHEGIYNGANYNYTGGTLIDELDGRTVTPGILFDACYTIVRRSPGATLTPYITVQNLVELFEMDCLDTTLQETAELLAALLGPDGLRQIQACGVTWQRLGPAAVLLEGCGT